MQMTRREAQEFKNVVCSILGGIMDDKAKRMKKYTERRFSSCEEDCVVRIERGVRRGKEKAIETISNALEEKLFDFKASVRRETIKFVQEKVDEAAH